jgi:hypothetical protein
MAMLDTSLRGFGLPAEVAAVAVIFGADEFSWTTGAEINIDSDALAASAAIPSQ